MDEAILWVGFLIVVTILGLVRLRARLQDANSRIDELSQRVRKLETGMTVPREIHVAAPAPIVRTPEVQKQRPPAPAPPPPQPPPPPPPPPPSVPTIDWEQFMGVKLFAWIGGLALFLGIAFFVKYSFDNNLVPPELRVAIGFALGIGLIAGGMRMSREAYRVLSQSLSATGVVTLYTVLFACHSIYDFPFFSTVTTFVLMALVTAMAFVLAARQNALVVAILGMLGGFLTPILLSTGQDRPFALFGYIAILNVGLILVAGNRRWYFLTALAAFGTAITQIGWAAKFFVIGRYVDGNKILLPVAMLLGFVVLYLIASWWSGRRQQTSIWLSGATLGLVAVSLGFTWSFIQFAELAGRPWLIFGFLFLIDLAVTAAVWIDERCSSVQFFAGLAVFGLLGIWTNNYLSSELLNPALVFYLLFAAFQSVVPPLLTRVQRKRGRSDPAHRIEVGYLFPIIALALVLVPIFRFDEVSVIVWPFILLVDVLAIGLAVMTMTLLPVLAVLTLTFAATGVLILKIPGDLTGISTVFLTMVVFAVFFAAASVWLMVRLKPGWFDDETSAGNDLSGPEGVAKAVSISSVTLPFLLLMMVTVRLPDVNAAAVFGLALLMVVMLLAVTRLFSLDWLPAAGLACVTALELEWRFAGRNHVPSWYVIFFAVFTLFPFLFLNRFREKVVPWATAAMVGLPQFLLIYRFIRYAHPNEYMGAVPAVFAIPPLLGMIVVLKRIPEECKARLTQLAWFGGVGLFFITLIFPIQFEHHWLTISWALEGAALLWLYHRVPHPGLRLTGLGLLSTVFARLALHTLSLDYEVRAATPIFNCFLYTYGITTVCLFVGARLLAPPRHEVSGTDVRPILNGLGTVLAFLLMNVEIADYFTALGAVVQFEFGGGLAREMTYSIFWALFALTLTVIGIVRKAAAARYAALGLLSVTLLKLFLYDLASLNQLYRIGAFVGVAVIAILASFAYQRFFNAAATGEGLP